MQDAPRLFDRTQDVSKLIGCNTRNVAYRWGIYERHLASVPAGSAVLDYGAGSLRESFDFAFRGYRVTALDLDLRLMQAYLLDYTWAAEPTLITEMPHQGSFSVTGAFDVIEHQSDVHATLQELRSVAAPGGLMFVTVPNRHSFSELLTRRAGRTKRYEPGEAHLQFHSPSEWRAIFEVNRWRVIDHDMAIGPLVNTVWWGAYHAKTKLLRRSGGPADDHTPRLGMGVLDGFDKATKPLTRGLYTWCLFVLKTA